MAHGHHGNMHPPKKLKDAKGTLKRLLSYLSGHFGKIALVLFFCALTAIISIVGTRLNGVIVDDFIAVGDVKGLAFMCLLLLAIYLISVVASYVQNVIMIDISQVSSAKIRRDLFGVLGDLPLKYLDSHSGGDLMSRLTNDVDNISTTLSQNITQLFSGSISVIGTLIAMIMLSPMLTLISMVTVPLMFLLTSTTMKFSRKFFKQQQSDLGELNGYIEEMISGQKAVKLFSYEEKSKEQFAAINKKLQKSSSLAQSLSGLMGPMMNMIGNLSYLIVATAGAYMILKGHGMTVGIVFSFLLYMKNFSRPLSEIASLFNTIQSALSGAERVFEVMDEPKEQDGENAVNADDIKGDIDLNNVTFSYVEGTPVLKNATIHAKSGEQIAIVGPTGAGKTTIISLLTRFYDLDSGEILIDGKPITDYTRNSVRRCVGMVLQDTFLFSETVKDNIRYGRLDATDEEVIAAAKLANAHSFITHLPHGYDTVLSDNAGNLSQGQRQLIAIARAILADPCVLILDEATSSIDTRTEIEIQNAMLKLMENRTSFIIAHRLSTIKNADSILVVNHGEIVEKGTHTELLEKGGFYAELYNSQFKTGMAI